MKTAVFTYQQDAHKKYLWAKDTRLQPYTTDDLEILIATMDRDDLSFLEKIFSQSVNQIEANILIVNQSKSKRLESDFDHIRIINDTEYGLSRSRNIAIRNMKRSIGWLLDDDCIVLADAQLKIVTAHNQLSSTVITFQTEVIETGRLFWEYPHNTKSLNKHDRELIEQILSPEITFKKHGLNRDVSFDERFGLGAQFQDSENFIFLNELLQREVPIVFYPETIVKHERHNSSDEPTSDRVIYARGALAAYFNQPIFFQSWKYVFFLLRKGLVTSPKELMRFKKLFQNGAADYHHSQSAIKN